MPKYVLTTVASLFFAFVINAQSFKIEESAPLKEPQNGWLKIIQLKNGNTALINITLEDGVNVKLYDPLRKLIAEKLLKPLFGAKGELRNADVEGAFNIGNDLIVLITTSIDKTPALIRLVIDGASGDLKKEEEIGRLKDYNRWDAFSFRYGKAYGNVKTPRFIVRKDPYSDNYGVAFFNTQVSDKSKRIELIHFGSDNQEINRSFYASPNDEFKHMDLIDFIVIGNEKLIATAYTHNPVKEGKSFLALASLEKGSPNLKLKQLDFSEGKDITAGLLRYNKKENLLVLVGVNFIGEEKSVKYYNAILTIIDPKNLSISYTTEINAPKLEDEYKRIFGDKKEFRPSLQDLYVNQDGTYAIVFEELAYESISSNMGSAHTTTTIKIGSTAVTLLDEKTKVTNSYLIPKSQSVIYTTYSPSDYTFDFNPLYISRRQGSSQLLKDATQYKSFTYLNGKNGNYIFFNDLVENLTKISTGKLTTLSGVSATDAFVCTMKDGQIKKDLLFGELPKKQHAFAMFTVSDYNIETGTYVTLKLENGANKAFKVIWFNP